MNNKGNVFVILTPGFAADETDTACLPMQQSFVTALAELYPGVTIMVLCFHYPFFKKSYQWNAVSVTSFNGRNKGGLHGILLRKKVEQALGRIYEEHTIVGILSFWLGECAYVGKKFAEKKGLRHFAWLLGQDAKSQNKYVLKLPFRAKEMIALSDFLQNEFDRNYGIRPLSVITPGVAETCASKANRDIDLLGVGSLIPLKRFGMFVEMVAAIKKEIPGIKAVLAGDGPEGPALRKLISCLGVENNIELTGAISYKDVLHTMQRTKVLLHPSAYEGYSGVCQEALSNGTHVISFCRAMDVEIDQWHIVKTKNEMLQKAQAILRDPTVTYNNVHFQSMKNTAMQVMELYG